MSRCTSSLIHVYDPESGYSLSLYLLRFQSNRVIQAGEHITTNYGRGFVIRRDQMQPGHVYQRCLCQAAGCPFDKFMLKL